MHNTEGLNIREIFHFHYGICQMVYFARTACWVGLNEKKQALWAPDKNGHPEMERIRKPQYLYREQLPYLEVLNSHFAPQCAIIDYAVEEQEVDFAF